MGLKEKEKVSLSCCQEVKMETSSCTPPPKKKCTVAQERDWGCRHESVMVFGNYYVHGQ